MLSITVILDCTGTNGSGCYSETPKLLSTTSYYMTVKHKPLQRQKKLKNFERTILRQTWSDVGGKSLADEVKVKSSL